MISADLHGLTWRTMERADDAIEYTTYDGATKNYFPDFFVESGEVYECKPKRLWDTPTVRAKRLAAIKICMTKGWTYNMVDPEIPTRETMRRLLDIGQLQFTAKYAPLIDDILGATICH